MPNIVQVTVKTKATDLLRFMLFHAFSKPSGILTLTAAIVSLLCLPFSIFLWKDQFVTLALALLVFIYLILTPLNMFSQSKRQVSSNPVFKNPITYHISEEIFEVQQYTGTLRLYWTQLVKIRMTPFDYLFYVNEEQAFVMPKNSVSPEEVVVLTGIIDQVKKELNQEPIKPEENFSHKNRSKSKESKTAGVESKLKELAVKESEEHSHSKTIHPTNNHKSKQANGQQAKKQQQKNRQNLPEQKAKQELTEVQNEELNEERIQDLVKTQELVEVNVSELHTEIDADNEEAEKIALVNSVKKQSIHQQTRKKISNRKK